jgi:uncharacterized membrane protein
MAGWLESSTAQLIFWTALLAVLVAAGAYVVTRLRGSAGENQAAAGDLLSNFREMHSQGELSDEEFRTIKTLLADKLQRETNNTDKTG